MSIISHAHEFGVELIKFALLRKTSMCFISFKLFGHFAQLWAPVSLIVFGNSLIAHWFDE